jgi:hypothetical protein
MNKKGLKGVRHMDSHPMFMKCMEMLDICIVQMRVKNVQPNFTEPQISQKFLTKLITSLYVSNAENR